jgi:hypothetical protein
MICQTGRIRVKLEDGMTTRVVELSPGDAVLVPAAIFASETFLEKDSSLLVLCDRPFEPDDYLHTWEEFLQFRASSAPHSP